MVAPNRMDTILDNTSSIVHLGIDIFMAISSIMNEAPVMVAESILFSFDDFMLYLAPRKDDISRIHIEPQNLISVSICPFQIKKAATAHMIIELVDAINVPFSTAMDRKGRILCDGFCNISPPLFDISYVP